MESATPKPRYRTFRDRSQLMVGWRLSQRRNRYANLLSMPPNEVLPSDRPGSLLTHSSTRGPLIDDAVGKPSDEFSRSARGLSGDRTVRWTIRSLRNSDCRLRMRRHCHHLRTMRAPTPRGTRVVTCSTAGPQLPRVASFRFCSREQVWRWYDRFRGWADAASSAFGSTQQASLRQK